MKQAHVFITGNVQGIGYRAFVKSLARKFGVFGWVRNLSDGRVEGVFQGEEGSIDSLVERCWKGPFLAAVKDVKVSWEEAEDEYMDFRVTS